MVESLPCSREDEELRLFFSEEEQSSSEGKEKFFSKLQNIQNLDDFLARTAQLLDQVETELIGEVSAKSDAFFAALSSLGGLSDEVSSLMTAADNCHFVISDLQDRYKTEIHKLEQLNKEQLIISEAQRMLGLIIDLVKSQHTIQTMLDTHSFEDALKLVNRCLGTLNKELEGIRTFDRFRQEMIEMKVALEKMQRADDMLSSP